jgi:DNA (cytosine-5)-methyltransferase 1
MATRQKNNLYLNFIDLFAGIGGIRLGFQNAAKNKVSVNCFYTSEMDKYACKTYRKNYPKDDPCL